MKTYLDCIPCALQQSLRAGRMATDDETKLKEILDRTAQMLQSINMHSTPAENGAKVYQIVSEVTGVSDPYRETKKKHIQEAWSIYPELEKMVENSEDRLLTAIKVAIAGNIIDLGVIKEFDILTDIRKIMEQDFGILDYYSFKTQLEQTEEVLYLGDNSGESVFDRILIKELKKPTKYVVRSEPIINDVTRQEAKESRIHEVAEIIESGTRSPGIILPLSSPEFLEEFTKAGLVISKGQGNLEGLSGCDRQVFFLLKAKCRIISDHIGVEEGAILLMENKSV